ncbi:hypothetical protein NL676_015921 [Syzygium grande]|nr:hypothetical protein NL676_015921 [Syzygium grande]
MGYEGNGSLMSMRRSEVDWLNGKGRSFGSKNGVRGGATSCFLERGKGVSCFKPPRCPPMLTSTVANGFSLHVHWPLAKLRIPENSIEWTEKLWTFRPVGTDVASPFPSIYLGFLAPPSDRVRLNCWEAVLVEMGKTDACVIEQSLFACSIEMYDNI